MFYGIKLLHLKATFSHIREIKYRYSNRLNKIITHGVCLVKSYLLIEEPLKGIVVI